MRASADGTEIPSALPRDPLLTGLTLDSRKVQPGYLFAALAGARQDGAAFVADAVRRGAVAILAAHRCRRSIPRSSSCATAIRGGAWR
jgi:UDP-N-acetylmuramoyl-L-alanyl-D-glutamate--2,6-diaminopimelate ligase